MARTKVKEDAWERYRDELKILWLDERRTLEQVRDYMSQTHNFCQRSVATLLEVCWDQLIPECPISKYQYTRHFKEWGFRKNAKEEEWMFVASRGEKRKRDGKDIGPVRIHGKLIPESTVRKEISRHVKLSSSQSLGNLGQSPLQVPGLPVKCSLIDLQTRRPLMVSSWVRPEQR